MTIRKIVTFAEDVRAHNGKDLPIPLRRANVEDGCANTTNTNFKIEQIRRFRQIFHP